MRLLLDTNVFLEILLGQERSEEAKQLLSQEEHEFFVTDYAVHSIGMLLFRRGQHKVFHQFVRDVLIQAGVVMLSLGAEDLDIVIYVAQEFHLDFDDAYQYAAAEKHGLTLVSLDADFDRTPQKRKVPADFLPGWPG